MSDMHDDLHIFISRHARSYDSASDTYRCPPYAQSVKASKSSPIYKAHTYHTKVPPEGIVPYIEHYTDPGDLVLDPFCGSGMVGVAALMSSRNAFLSDLSPAAVHIARNYCTPVDVATLHREFERIKAEVKEEFNWLYGTVCARCGGSATIQYTVWSDVFECKRCGNDIVLWENSEHSIVEKDGEKEEDTRLKCSTCSSQWRKVQLIRTYSKPVFTDYECPNCKPKRENREISDHEKALVNDIEGQDIPYWYPNDNIDPGREMMRLGLLKIWFKRTSDFYTRRNLRAFAALWDAKSRIGDVAAASIFSFALTSIIPYISRKQGYGGGGGGLSATLYTPSLHKEQNVLTVLERKMKKILQQFPLRKFKSDFYITKMSATNISVVPSDVVDYIFTDPPFGQNIFYADASILWDSWLQDYTDEELEIVCNDRRQNGLFKTTQDYQRLMTEAFREMNRVLKPGRWASVIFHNSDDSIWQSILEAVDQAGFELAEINAFDKGQLSFKGVRGAKGLERVTNKDIVLNLRKPAPTHTNRSNGHSDQLQIEQRIAERVADFLATNPSEEQRTLQHLWNHVLFDMLRNGSVEIGMAGVEEMLKHHYQTFKLIDGRYYLRGESVIGGNVFDLRSDSGAITWLTSLLSNEPRTAGDLIPLWQQETAHLGGAASGRLEDLLEQNFWQDKRTGRWRLPTTAEREKMSAREDLGAQAHLRVVHRFLEGKLDYHPSDIELAAWIRFCYNREFFSEAADLFQHTNQGVLDSEEYKAIKRMATVSRMRAGPDEG